ncbi:hypothetical protein UT300005_06720 [Clostridium sp. CTA-5]
MNLLTKKRFNNIKREFISGDYDLQTIRWLVAEIRNTIWDIDKEEFEKLINIPISILKQDVCIEDYELWQKENKNYLLKNLSNFKEKYFLDLKAKIYQEKYSIKDMLETLEYINENFNELKEKYHGEIEIPLRNIEIVFKNLKLLKEEELILNKELFVQRIEYILREVS